MRCDSCEQPGLRQSNYVTHHSQLMRITCGRFRGRATRTYGGSTMILNIRLMSTFTHGFFSPESILPACGVCGLRLRRSLGGGTLRVSSSDVLLRQPPGVLPVTDVDGITALSMESARAYDAGIYPKPAKRATTERSRDVMAIDSLAGHEHHVRKWRATFTNTGARGQLHA